MEKREKIADILDAYLAKEGQDCIDPNVERVMMSKENAVVVEHALWRRWNAILSLPLAKEELSRLHFMAKEVAERRRIEVLRYGRLMGSALVAAALVGVVMMVRESGSADQLKEPSRGAVTQQTVVQKEAGKSAATFPTVSQRGGVSGAQSVGTAEPLDEEARGGLSVLGLATVPLVAVASPVLVKEFSFDTPRQIVVPEGMTELVQMVDGSSVTVQGGSVLRILPSEGTAERRVALEGVAEFDVKHDGVRPFVVQTQAFTVNVLGTAFALSVIPNEEVARIRLERGSVEIRIGNELRYRLKPGEELRYNRETLGLSIE